jgi:hypothetical protein
VASTPCHSAWISSVLSNRCLFSFNFIFWKQEEVTGCQIRGVRWMGYYSRFVFLQKLLGEDGSVRWGRQEPGHKFGFYTVLTISFVKTRWHVPNQFPPAQQSPTSILTDELSNLCNSSRSGAACESPYVRHRQRMCERS